MQGFGIGNTGCLNGCCLGLQSGQFLVAELHTDQLRLGFVRQRVGHGADNIGGNALVDVEAKFLPVSAIEAACGLVFALGATADVEESFHFDDTMKKPRLLVRDGVLVDTLTELRVSGLRPLIK